MMSVRDELYIDELHEQIDNLEAENKSLVTNLKRCKEKLKLLEEEKQ